MLAWEQAEIVVLYDMHIREDGSVFSGMDLESSRRQSKFSQRLSPKIILSLSST